EPRAVARGRQDRLLQAVVQQRPVREPRQRVVVRLLLDAGLIEAAFRDVLDRAFVMQDAAVVAEDGARVLRDPDDVAILAVDLRLEVADRAARLDDAHELLAPRRVDVELRADVLQRLDELLRRREAVDARERGIRVEILAVRRRAEYPFDRVLEEAVIAALGLAQRLLGLGPLRDVLDEALEVQQPAVVGVDADPALPDP